jgi:adenylate cyclase
MKFLVNKRLLVGLAIALCTAIACCIAFQLNLFSGLQLYTGDTLFRVPSIDQRSQSGNKIALVAIDEKSLEQLGRFSLWPRSYYADLTNNLVKANARLIVFDVLFPEPTPDDDEMAVSIKAANNVVLSTAHLSQEGNSAVTDKQGSSSTFLRPVPLLAENAIALGHVNLAPDSDGTVRRLTTVISDGEAPEPALALAAVAKYLRRPTVIEQPAQNGVLPLAGRSIPIDDYNEMIINYSTGLQETQAAAFPVLSFVDVLSGKIDTSLVEDKIVFIGAIASGLGDIFWTPLGKMMNGVEIHAIATQTILANDFITPAPSIITIVFILVLALLCGLIVLLLRPLYAALLALSVCLIYFLFVTAYFDRGIMFNMFYPPAAILVTFLSVNIYSATWERTRRKEITKTFGRYVSTSVADKIVSALDRGDIKLGGELQEITVAFADVRGFTAIANTMKTEDIVSALNRYLSVVIEVVNKYHGVVNKFGGDSIMSIWNAPTVCPGHPLLAIKAAIETHKAIRELQQKEPSLPKMDFGIGINTGPAVAGNLGSPDRLEYSVIGSTVNLASRLTSATPGGKLWISDSTFKLVQSYVEVMPLGEITIAGKQEKFRAYEVVSVHPDAISGKAKSEIGVATNIIEGYA